ncbi:accessory gene regulator B family protein [Longibaculum muris]|uniref:accessory gene regulator B family protein n=1 Tax=Longibaculum muris TaxID=1796628 RepID=UPI0022DFF07E|nr:accessory gene regulator B family protein [Longibaculum muris]
MENIAETLTRFLEKKEIIKEDRNIYKYGFESFISTFIGTIILIDIGLITHYFIEALIYESIFTFVRKYTGGYHCKSHHACIFLYNFIFILYVILNKTIQLHLISIFILLMISFVIIIK